MAASNCPGPYETFEQANEAVRGVYDVAHSAPRGAMAETNHGRLLDACKAAGVYLGTYDHMIVRWLAGWDPETVQVVVGLITRANQDGDR